MEQDKEGEESDPRLQKLKELFEEMNQAEGDNKVDKAATWNNEFGTMIDEVVPERLHGSFLTDLLEGGKFFGLLTVFKPENLEKMFEIEIPRFLTYEFLRIDDRYIGLEEVQEDRWEKSDIYHDSVTTAAQSFYKANLERFPKNLNQLTSEILADLSMSATDYRALSPHKYLSIILNSKLKMLETQFNFILQFQVAYGGYDSGKHALREIISNYRMVLNNPNKQVGILQTTLMDFGFRVSKQTADNYARKVIELCERKLVALDPEYEPIELVSKEQTSLPEVFVVHAWSNGEPSDEAIALTDFLRQNGWHAEMDVLITGNQSSIDFQEMMSRAFTDYEKVVVMLSEDYKNKADNFKGGVAVEYRVLLRQIAENPSKFVLVTYGAIEKTVPEMLRSREIIDLRADKKQAYKKFLSRLSGTPDIEFSEVAPSKRAHVPYRPLNLDDLDSLK